ncbi:hypothetical protein CapIbe_000721 [Capra ibex]
MAAAAPSQHVERLEVVTCPPDSFGSAALPARAWAWKGQRCPVLPCLHCHSGCPGLATAKAAGDPHGVLAFILTFVYSTNVRGALNQCIETPEIMQCVLRGCVQIQRYGCEMLTPS